MVIKNIFYKNTNKNSTVFLSFGKRSGHLLYTFATWNGICFLFWVFFTHPSAVSPRCLLEKQNSFVFSFIWGGELVFFGGCQISCCYMASDPPFDKPQVGLHYPMSRCILWSWVFVCHIRDVEKQIITNKWN